MEFCALASGSSGNCFYVEHQGKAVLIDAGISTKKIVEGLDSIGKTPDNVSAIFITHEHTDHIKGSDVFARKFNVPVFATKKTIQNGLLCSDENLLNVIKNDEIVRVGGMEVEAFSKTHAAADPVSFTVVGPKRVSVITDAGHACKNICGEISDADFLCLESNHDLKMLQDGPYPAFLKKWVSGDTGHLSNMQAALSVLEYSSPKLNHVMLAHLSATNNIPELAAKTFKNVLKERLDSKASVSVSTRECATKVFRI